MLRNIIGPILTQELGHFCVFFLKNPFLSPGRTRFPKTKKNKKTKHLDQLLTLEKANLGPVLNSTTHIYIYIYIYTHMLESQKLVQVLPFSESKVGPSFSFFPFLFVL